MRTLFSSLAVLAIFATPMVAHADTLATFNLTGTLSYNYNYSIYTVGEPAGTVSGTVVIDVTTGNFYSEDVTYTGTDSGTYTFNGLATTTYSNYQNNNFTYEIFGSNSYAPGSAYLQIDLPSLVGYTGGGLCTLAAPCPGNNASNLIESASDVPNISSGTLTPVTSVTPEPSSLVLLGTGILAAAGIARRRFLKA